MKVSVSTRFATMPNDFFINKLIDHYELEYRANIREEEVTREEETYKEFVADVFYGECVANNRDELISGLVNLVYSTGDEIALMRKQGTEEYEEYLAYVEKCKGVNFE